MPRRRLQDRPVPYPRDAATADRIADVVERARHRYHLAGRAERWQPWAAGAADLRGSATVLALDDYSRIPFVETVVGAAWYQYRARLRCGDGDYYVVAQPPIEGYEDYNRRYLGLGRTHLLRLREPPSELELARGLRSDGAAFDRLCALARDAGGLLLHPYMAIQAVWELAEALGEATGTPIRVLGPYPHVTLLANNKARFSEIVEWLLGAGALVHTATANDPRLIAEHLRDHAHRYAAVALKMPSCASGTGNRVFDSAALRGKPARVFLDLVSRFLDEKEWDGREEVLAVEWRRDVLESPSTQCWIPSPAEGEPEIAEVFEQFLVGEEQVFEGAMLSALPRAIRHDFMIRSWLICRVFQALGYVGRCSFDALVVGNSLKDARIKFVECNGRWGGTSTPMHLMNRVFGDFRAIPYKAQDYLDPRLAGLEFQDLMEIFGRHLYDRRTGTGRVLLYNVGGVTQHGKFDIVVTGRGHTEIERFIHERVPALIERYLDR